MKATVTDRFVNLEGFKYFTGKASDVRFGAWGDKKTPIGPGKLNYLEVEGVLPAPELAEVRLVVTSLTVEFADAKGLNLLAGLKVPGLASGKVGLTAGDFSSGRVALVKISPQGEGDLVRQYNASPRILEKLIYFGGGAHVVKSVLIAVEGRLFDRFSASLVNNGAVMVDGVMVQAERSAGWEKSSAVEVGSDMTLAYSLAEPKWDAHQDKNKTRILDLRDDQQGL